MKIMDPSELVKQPQDVTENPYRHSAKGTPDKQKTSFVGAAAEEVSVRKASASVRFIFFFCFYFEKSSVSVAFLFSAQEPVGQFFFDLSRKQDRGQRGRGWKRRDGAEDGRHPGQPKQPRRHRESDQ